MTGFPLLADSGPPAPSDRPLEVRRENTLNSCFTSRCMLSENRSSEKQMSVFKSELNNQRLASIYEDVEPQKVPNVCVKHVFHQTCIQPSVFAVGEF